MLYHTALDEQRMKLHVDGLQSLIRAIADNISVSSNPAFALKNTIERLIEINNELQRLDFTIDKAHAYTAVKPISLDTKPTRIDALMQEALSQISETALKNRLDDVRADGIAKRILDKVGEK